ncbi:Dihydroceramide fatty acyl 2-hydroxylase FAH1, partial [Cucurbita argyrosperma subsp. argyrosperma]
MVAQGFTVDLNKPLVFQVGHLGEDYQEWVHQPIVSKEGPRFFESDFWEFWNLIKLFATPSTTPCLVGGGLLGYVMYDVTHHYLHHGQPSGETARNLKKYHLNHHFRIQTLGFGITSSLWDKVFGTLPPPSKVAEKRR